MRIFQSPRALAPALVAAGALLALSASASAGTLTQIDGSVNPAISFFATTPQPLSLSLDVRFASDVAGELPGTVSKATIFFPRGPRVNGALFPSCNPKRLQQKRGARSACPKGSRLGSGTAVGTSPQFGGVNEHLTVQLYNGPGGRSILFYLQGLNPVAVSGMINAPFVPLRGRGRWGYRLTLNVPESLQQIGRGIFASLLDFQTNVKASVKVREHGRMVRRSYIEVMACPPGALVPVRGEFSFRGGGSSSTDSYIACGHK